MDMSSILEFITSAEVIIAGIIILVLLILALIIFLIEKNYYKRKQKYNLQEINKIVEQDVKQESVDSNSALIPPVETKQPLVIPIEEYQQNKKEPVSSIQSIYQEVKEEVEQLQCDNPKDNKQENGKIETLKYTDPEPNMEEAKEELRKATEELIKQEETQNKNIDLTDFEAEQEENAIISLDELMAKSDLLYQQNEVTQYQDEGNEPISLKDLEDRMKAINIDIKELTEEDEKVEKEPVISNNTVKLDDIYTIGDNTKAYREDVVFKSSPIISPIFGIEDNSNEQNLELENTANYDKLDEEIKKTNQFLVTLKELQKKLD